MSGVLSLIVFLLGLPASLPPANAALQTPSTAEACGDCHRAIYDGWKGSAHASAMESRLFQDALKMAEESYGAQARRTCLGCHSPVAVRVGDLDLIRKVSWEGVTCDFCHSVRAVTMAGPNPRATVEFTLVKSGPSKDVASPVHGTAYSTVHTTSLACVICHEYRNAQGFAVLTTYSEWQASTYGKSAAGCQTCHMYAVKGKVVDPRVARVPENEVNLHQMPGSHSLDQLNRAIRAQLSAVRDGDTVHITVKLTNAGAGHSVPTGSPLRRMILVMKADGYPGVHESEQRVYARTVADASGARVQREDVAFVKAAKVLSDTRIAAGETRTETMTVTASKGALLRVEASLFYYYSPMAGTEAQQKVRFLTLTKMVQ